MLVLSLQNAISREMRDQPGCDLLVYNLEMVIQSLRQSTEELHVLIN